MKIFKLIIISLLLGGAAKIYAQNPSNKERFILTQTIDNEVILYPFSKTSNFSILPDEVFIINNPESQDTEIDLKKISAWGIISKDAESDYREIISQEINDQWSIYSLDGTLLLTGHSRLPFDSLKKGCMYIIKFRNKTYKYLPL